MRARALLAATAVTLLAHSAAAQPPTRIAILIAEDRRAPTPRDLAVIRAGVHSKDADTCRISIRALGRLERPSLIADIVPLLRSPWPEVRAEAANAIGQAAQGWKAPGAPPAGVSAAAEIVAARLAIETEPDVRAALCETLGRLPYTTADQVRRAEAVIGGTRSRDETVQGQLGVALGLEGLIRLHGRIAPLSPETIASLATLASGTAANGVRVRRVAFDALITARQVTNALVVHGLADSDAQVRRLALKAIGSAAVTEPVEPEARELAKKAMFDDSPIVRLEALGAASFPASSNGGARTREDGCPVFLQAVDDHDTQVALAAIDLLGSCGQSPEAADAIDRLERTVNDLSSAGSPRGWHASAHAIVALTLVAPDKARAALPQFAGSSVWQLRMYAARAAASLKEDTSTLEKLAADPDDNVCEAAVEGLSRFTAAEFTKGSAEAEAAARAAAIYESALSRRGYQAIRAAALALQAMHAPTASAIPALRAVLKRLNAEGGDNSRDARTAVAEALRAHDVPAPAIEPARRAPTASELNADELRRLASVRARITIRDVGVFELALFTAEAPASVTRFARLVQSGYYNGLTFHRVVPNFVIQGGSPGANEYIGDRTYMRDEVGLWPHVRGAVGISTRGRDTGDAQIFVDLVDNPRLDHEYTVFAQVLNGMDVVDRILEGDVIERIEIVL